MQETTITVTTADDIALQTFRWAPEGEPRAVVQVQHGLAEHAARYRRFAEALSAAGYLVYAPDGGVRADGGGRYGAAGPGWMAGLGRRPGATQRQDQTGQPGAEARPVRAQHGLVREPAVRAGPFRRTFDVLARAVREDRGQRGWRDMLDTDEPADLSAFNAPFEIRTGYEWLSRDEDEVDKYVADEGCGFVSATSSGIGTLKQAAVIRSAWQASARTCRPARSGTTTPLPAGAPPWSWSPRAIGTPGPGRAGQAVPGGPARGAQRDQSRRGHGRHHRRSSDRTVGT